MRIPEKNGLPRCYTLETLAVLGDLGSEGIETVQTILDSAAGQRTVSLPNLIDEAVVIHQRHEHFKHRKGILRDLGYTSLHQASPAIADAYLDLAGASERLKKKVVQGKVGLMGLVRGPWKQRRDK